MLYKILALRSPMVIAVSLYLYLLNMSFVRKAEHVSLLDWRDMDGGQDSAYSRGLKI